MTRSSHGEEPMILLRLGRREAAAIQQRSAERCLVFADEPLPTGTTPAVGRIGIEQAGGRARLLVDRAQPSAAATPAVQQWLRTGAIEFDDLNQLWEWIHSELRDAYGVPSVVDAPASTPPGRLPAHELTDLSAVEVDESGEGPFFLNPQEMLAHLEQQVVGQHHALATMTSAAVRHVARAHPARPLTVMSVGPTGVGKTSAALHLASALAAQTDRNWGFVRLEGPELQEAHAVAKLIGSPPGYIGYGDVTPLGDALRTNPRTVVLFDEVEKAHRNVFQALMTLIDTGRLTDAHGTVDATAAVFLFTSNLAAEPITAEIRSSGCADRADRVDQIARRHLRSEGVLPELVGRMTHIVAFADLEPQDRARVAALAVQRVAATYGVEVTWIEPQLVSKLLAGSIDWASGVRALEHRADAIFGDVLIEAAQSGRVAPIRLVVDGEGVTWQSNAGD